MFGTGPDRVGYWKSGLGRHAQSGRAEEGRAGYDRLCSAVPRLGGVCDAWRPLSSVCRSEGRFPAPGECEGYVECVAQREGSLNYTAHYYRCPSGFFHPTLARCVVLAQVSHVLICQANSIKDIHVTPTALDAGGLC